ncbi:F-box DNA helicase 1-like [Pecten maximus]|uniref:F-box DNA helicase 1-like n=1 Tax=Pecten maximus TaxID=6579 RepID=UPI001457EFA2|nr:F-box DNA helicase 1-like [Pecten maximus]
MEKMNDSPSEKSDVTSDGKENPEKKRRIHMDVQECFAHAQTEDGIHPLSNPLESSSRPKPYKLTPRPPRIKASYAHGVHNTYSSATVVSETNNDSPSLGSRLVDAYHNKTPGGFGSATLLCASSMLPELADLQKESITTNQNAGTVHHKTLHTELSSICVPKQDSCDNKSSTPSTVTNRQGIRTSDNSQEHKSIGNLPSSSNKTLKSNDSQKNSRSNTPSKSGKQPILPNQQKMTNFFTSSKECKSESEKSCHDDSYVYGTVASSYTPIKNVGGSSVVFVIDDESPDFLSRQKASQESSSGYSSTKNSPAKCSLKDFKENAVVKKLFAGQKSLVDNPNLKPVKASSVSSSPNRFGSHKKSMYSKKEPKTEQLMRMEIDSISSSDDECMSQALDCAITDTFGLLGNGTMKKKEEEKIDYFSILPTEVMEHIFCHLPMLDLCLNSNKVCKRWNEIISSEKFMPWKKRYHKLKKNVEGTTDEMIGVLKTNNMRSPSLFLTQIISYMRDIKPVTSSNMNQCLQTLPKYHWAKELLDERAPHCIINKEPNPWSMITCLVIIADSVQEIQKVLACLTSPMSDCTTQEVLECLYRLAAFFMKFKRLWSKGPFTGIHYRLFYALYLYENASASNLGDLKGALTGKAGQQCMVKYGCAETSLRLTHEQMRVVNHDCLPGELAKIVAFAGTGKTTTLVRYTQLRPQTKFLLVVFNKSVCDHARTKFPRNVDCKTGHALAFGKVGFRYKNAGKFRGNGPTVYSITQTIQNKKGDNLFVRAKFVLDTLNTFLSSADPIPTEDHVPDFRTDDAGNRVPIDPLKRKMYVDDTSYLWNRMKDLNDKNVPISHDGYLKLYQLSRPRLHYDCILIDEAQDLTPAISDILLSQNTSKILVGDPHQQIYSFRGAINSMQIVQASTIFYLTQSFRFGPEIAEIAACCLELLKNEKKKILVGNGQTCQVLGEQVGQLAVLTRCNFTLFNEAVKRCCHENTEDKVAFVGGTDGFGFGMIMDIYCLLLTPEQRKKERREIEHKLVRSFNSLPALEKYATKVQDNDLLGKIKIVRQHHHNLPGYIDKILKKTIRDTRVADVVLSTAHKSKGLEFSTVHLTDDYVTYIQLQELEQQFIGTPLRLPSEDESNLLYVAVTRAKNALIMSPTLTKLIQRAGCAFEYPVLSSVLKDKGVAFTCMKTGSEFKPYALTLQKRDVKLSNGTTIAGGVYSPGSIKVENTLWDGLLGTTAEDRKKEEEYEESRRNI